VLTINNQSSQFEYAIEFDKLVRMLQKQHNFSEMVPVFFIKSLVNLEASVNSTIQKEKEAKKKMNPSNAKALTAMKQKIKKSMKEYEGDVKKYQEVSEIVRSCKFLIKVQQDPDAFEREYLNHLARDSGASAQVAAPRTGGPPSSNDQVDEFTTVGKGGKVMQFTPESLFKHLKSVQEARGKKV